MESQEAAAKEISHGGESSYWHKIAEMSPPPHHRCHASWHFILSLLIFQESEGSMGKWGDQAHLQMSSIHTAQDLNM